MLADREIAAETSATDSSVYLLSRRSAPVILLCAAVRSKCHFSRLSQKQGLHSTLPKRVPNHTPHFSAMRLVKAAADIMVISTVVVNDAGIEMAIGSEGLLSTFFQIRHRFRFESLTKQHCHQHDPPCVHHTRARREGSLWLTDLSLHLHWHSAATST